MCSGVSIPAMSSIVGAISTLPTAFGILKYNMHGRIIININSK